MKRYLALALILVLMVLSLTFGNAFADDVESYECYLTIRDDSMWRPEVDLEYDGEILEDCSTTTVEVGRLLSLSAMPNAEVEKIYYCWDGGEPSYAEGPISYLDIPEFVIGSTHYFYAKALYKNGEYGEQKSFKFIISENNSEPTADDYARTLGALAYFEDVYSIANIPKDARIYIESELGAEFTCGNYCWDDSGDYHKCEEVQGGQYRVEIPDDFEVGSQHELSIFAYSKDGRGGDNTYYITIVESMDEFVSVGIREHEMEYPRDCDMICIHYNENVEVKASAFTDDIKMEYAWWDEPTSTYEGDSMYFTMNCCKAEDDVQHDLHFRAITNSSQTEMINTSIYIIE